MMPSVADEEPNERLGDVVRELRVARGLSQQQLVDASRGKLTSGHIGQIETHKRGAGVDRLSAIADAMRLSNAERRRLFRAGGKGSTEDRVIALEVRVDQLAEQMDRFEAEIMDRLDELAAE
jgi:transcriptional regulator with XRE-family HTH domain